MLEIIQLPVLTDNYSYLLHDAETGKTAVVDPAAAEPVLVALQQRGWQLTYILNTHHHLDHVNGNLPLKQQTDCQIIGSAFDRQCLPGIDITVNHTDSILLGTQRITVLATPGHTLGHVVFYCSDSNALFCGDTLFSMGCGRLFEGSAQQMWQSLQIIKALPADTQIYCAHEYTEANARFALSLEANNPALIHRAAEVKQLRAQNQSTLPTTLAQELATNPFLRIHSPAIRAAVNAHEQDADDEVFAKVRLLKDKWQ